MLRGLGNRVALYQNVFAAEFILRVASFWRVAVALDAVVKFKERRIVAERGVDLFLSPNIENAFAMFGFSLFEKTVCVFGGKKSAILGRHVARDVIENVAIDRFEF